MPKIYEYFGFVFAFFVKDHLPVHVHVSKQQRESKIELHFTKNGLKLIGKEVRGRLPLKKSELKEAKDFVNHYHVEIVNKWTEVMVYNKKVSCEIIREKI
jgi:hypothetical protein